MQKIILVALLLICCGCTPSYFDLQNEAITNAEKSGKISTLDALKLRNDLYRTVQESENGTVIIPLGGDK